MRQPTAKSTAVRRLAWALIALIAAALLAACGGDEDSARAPGSPYPPAPVLDDQGTPVAPQPPQAELILPVDDSRSAAYSPDGSQIAFANGAAIWIYSSDLEQVRALKGHGDTVRAVAWSPDGTRIASASLDRSARIWDAQSGETLVTLSGHADWVLGVAWSPDGTQVVTASTDNSIRLWDVESGDALAQLGATRVEGIQAQFRDAGVFDTLAEWDYAETVLGVLEAEPLSDLVERVLFAGYGAGITFDDPAQVDLLLALDAAGYDLSIDVDDDTTREQINALIADERLALVMALTDPQVQATLADYQEAEATVAAINARDDADMIRAVRRLQQEDIVLVIQHADGETTTANPAENDLIATIADLEEGATVSFGIENEAAIVERLQDPDFVAAVQQYDAAQDTIAALTMRDDSARVLLAQRLQALDYTLMLTTGDETLDAALSALDNADRIALLELLQNTDLIAMLRRVQDAEYVLSDLDPYNLNAITSALAPLDYTIQVLVEDADIAETIAALDAPDVLRLAQLLENKVLRYAIQQRDEAQATIDDIQARDDYDLVRALRQLEKPNTMQTNISAPEGTSDVRVSRLRNEADYVLTFAPAEEALIQELSALDDGALADQFAAHDYADISAALDAGQYTIAPDIDTDALQAIVSRLDSDLFTITVQREANAHTDSVMAVAWSPDGAAIASTGADVTLRLWDPSSGKLDALIDLDEIGTVLAWSPDGAYLASGDWNNDVILWDTSAGAAGASEAGTFSGHDARVIALAWSPDGAYLASGGRGGRLHIQDVASGEERLAVDAHNAEISTIAWSPDGAQLITTGADGSLRVWDIAALLAE